MATNKNEIVQKSKKLVIIGDGMCGKTCLLFAFKDDQFIENHHATIFETYATNVQVKGKTVS
jgi:small GTP-binding protein